MGRRLQHGAATFVARLSNDVDLRGDNRRNRRSRCTIWRLRVFAGCSNRAPRSITNRRGSNCRWMKIQWQVKGSEIVENGKIRATWFVVPGSGTDELAGLR